MSTPGELHAWDNHSLTAGLVLALPITSGKKLRILVDSTSTEHSGEWDTAIKMETDTILTTPIHRTVFYQENGRPVQSIWCESSITQYGNVVNDTEHYIVDQRQQAAAFVASLQADQDSMLTNILSVRTDNYPSNASVYTYMPPNYNQLMYGGSPPPGKLAFLYASKRYTIPFGSDCKSHTKYSIYNVDGFSLLQFQPL